MLDARTEQRVLGHAEDRIAAEQKTGERHAEGKHVVARLSAAARRRRRHRRLDRQEGGREMRERRRADAFTEHHLLARRLAEHDVGGIDGAVDNSGRRQRMKSGDDRHQIVAHHRVLRNRRGGRAGRIDEAAARRLVEDDRDVAPAVRRPIDDLPGERGDQLRARHLADDRHDVETGKGRALANEGKERVVGLFGGGRVIGNVDTRAQPGKRALGVDPIFAETNPA